MPPFNKSFLNKLSQIRRKSEERVAQSRAQKLGKKYISLAKTAINISAVNLIPEETAKKSQSMAIEKKAKKVALVAVDSKNPETEKVIKDLESEGFEVSVFIVSKSSLNYGLTFYKYAEKELEEITGKVEVDGKEKNEIKIETIEDLKDALSKENFLGSKTGEIFELILQGAIKNRASDIHFEPTEENTLIRFRIDGLLQNIFMLDHKFYPYLVSRIKLLSNLKLNITDAPQDGRFTIEFPNKEIEVRVAVAPAQFGEVVVMRILDPDAININLKELGLRDDDLEIIQKELKRPNGMILNTGPTGSGKTTTLYAFLKHKKNPEIKIITIEDPIEYRLEGIEQTQVDEDSGYTFSSGLKSLMRQDPDIILVGEIRDKETAEIGIQAALTGHLVFSTVHANSASGAIPRLLDLDVKPVSVGPALNLVIGQRLVRRLCQCKTSVQIPEDLKNKINKFLENISPRVNKENYKNIQLFAPLAGGCAICNNTGYRGRIAIYELLLALPEMEELIIKQSGETAFLEFAKKHRMTNVQEDGILKVISGITTFDEIESATGPIEWQ